MSMALTELTQRQLGKISNPKLPKDLKKDDFPKEDRKDNGPNLSDPSLRQRSFPSSGAVLDVTGGGEGEESQDAQEEQRVRHRCWFWMSVAHLKLKSPAWVDV